LAEQEDGLEVMKMSNGESFPHEKAWGWAKDVVEHLSPLCERVEIAGSLRRLKLLVHDIEIVCVPKPTNNLLQETQYDPWEIIQTVDSWYMLIKGGSMYRQYSMGPINLDLFITAPEKWGIVFMMRTGPADFSRLMVTPRSKGGLMPSSLKVENGRLWLKSQKFAAETPEEKDVFTRMGLKYVYPEEREAFAEKWIKEKL
jgi:DNA polymerase/3'-5' exonuclease PolX